jgi:murein DD-endopeptidase MepM/ murein hydrolase activator NlpD
MGRQVSSDSFDPRSWQRQDKPDGASGTSGGTPVPEFWRAAAPEDTDASANGRPRKRKAALALAALGLAILAGASLMFFRAGDAPAAAAPTNAGVRTVQRAFSATGPDDIVAQLVRIGVSRSEAEAVARAATPDFAGAGEFTIDVALSGSPARYSVEEFLATAPDGSDIYITRGQDGGYVATAHKADLQQKIFVLRGELDATSFYSSAIAAGIDETLVPQMINAFAYDFNLASEISPGDTFEVGFQQAVNPAGKAVGPRTLVFASLDTPAKQRALYRFQPSGEEVGWFDGNGASTKRGLMMTPVDGARLTSVFGERFHPVLKYRKMHRGIDLAAPIGTAIYAAADGEVVFAAMKGNNGNFTILQHADGMQTYYLHQSRFMAGIQPGAHVTQGQKIGEIGTTGRSTGPHLHYEVHINGDVVDPLSVQTDDSKRKRLEGPERNAFIEQRDAIDRARAGVGG